MSAVSAAEDAGTEVPLIFATVLTVEPDGIVASPVTAGKLAVGNVVTVVGTAAAPVLFTTRVLAGIVARLERGSEEMRTFGRVPLEMFAAFVVSVVALGARPLMSDAAGCDCEGTPDVDIEFTH